MIWFNSLSKNNIFNFILKFIYYLIIIMGIIVITDILLRKDILFYDEVGYLKKGKNVFNSLILDGIVYHLYYNFIYNIFINSVLTYKSNQIILVLFIYVSLLKISFNNDIYKNLLLGLLVTNFILLSNILEIWPFITLFTCSWGVLFFYFRKERFPKNYIIILLIFFLLFYTRPDFLISFLVFSLFFIYECLKNFSKNHFIVILELIIICLIIYFFNPITNRSLEAFSQHFSFRAFLEKKITINPWTNYEYFNLIFSNPKSLLDVPINNPEAFFGHILKNLLDIPKLTYQLLGGDSFIEFILIIVYLIIFKISQLNNYIKKEKVLFIYTISFVSSQIFSLFVIYPREHYLLQLLIPGIIILFHIISKIYISKKIISLLIIINIFIFTNFIYFKLPVIPNIINENCSNTKIISFLNKIGKSPISILSVRGNICDMTENENCNHIYEWEKESNWINFQKKKNINYVIMEEELLNDPRFKEDLEFQKFFNINKNTVKICEGVNLIFIQ